MEPKRDFKGIWIDKNIWLDLNLTMMEKVVLMEIQSYDNDFGCVATNNRISTNMGVSPKTIGNIISCLSEKEYIEVKYSDYNTHSGRVIRVVSDLNEKTKREKIPTKRGSRKREGGLENQEAPLENQEHSNTFSNSFSLFKESKDSLFDNIDSINDNKDITNTIIDENQKIENEFVERQKKCRKDMIEFFCKEYWPTYKFVGGRDGKAINEMIEHSKKHIEFNSGDSSPEGIFAFFKIVIQNLPPFYKSKNLATINSDYSGIIKQIENGNKPQQSTAVRNEQRARQIADELRQKYGSCL